MAYRYIKANHYAYGDTRDKNDVRYIVIHYTGNVGDSARDNGLYFKNGNTRYAGAHFFVDQNGKVIKSVPMKCTAWSVGGYFTQANGAGKYYKKCLNSNSISIELCDCATKDPSDKMIKSVRKLVKHIQKHCPNAKTVIRHWDVNGKQCPMRMSGVNNLKWIAFKKDITGEVVKEVSYPTSTLKYGMNGSEVVKLQRCLNKIMKANLSTDGSFGPATLRAVKAFQKKYKLEVDGIVGPKTRAKIKVLVG